MERKHLSGLRKILIVGCMLVAGCGFSNEEIKQMCLTPALMMNAGWETLNRGAEPLHMQGEHEKLGFYNNLHESNISDYQEEQ